MKMFWWQGGVHIEPETNAEREWLLAGTQILLRGDIVFEALAGEIVAVEGDNQYPVVGVEKLEEIAAQA